MNYNKIYTLFLLLLIVNCKQIRQQEVTRCNGVCGKVKSEKEYSRTTHYSLDKFSNPESKIIYSEYNKNQSISFFAVIQNSDTLNSSEYTYYDNNKIKNQKDWKFVDGNKILDTEELYNKYGYSTLLKGFNEGELKTYTKQIYYEDTLLLKKTYKSSDSIRSKTLEYFYNNDNLPIKRVVYKQKDTISSCLFEHTSNGIKIQYNRYSNDYSDQYYNFVEENPVIKKIIEVSIDGQNQPYYKVELDEKGRNHKGFNEGDHTVTIQYDANGNVSVRNYYDNGELYSKYSYKYHNKTIIMERKEVFKNGEKELFHEYHWFNSGLEKSIFKKSVKMDFEYVFDSEGNWIEKRVISEKGNILTKKEIEYYDDRTD